MAQRLRRTRFLPPYLPSGRTTFSEAGCPGCYIITKAGRIRYVGFSANNVYKTLYRHFQKWNDPRQERVTYMQRHDVRVRVLYTPSAAKARELERALIIKHQPPDNTDKLKGYRLTDEGHTLVTASEDNTFYSPGEAPF